VFSAFTSGSALSFYVHGRRGDYYDAHRQSRLERQGALEPESLFADHFPETLVNVRRPALCLHSLLQACFPSLGAKIMVAWNASRESDVLSTMPCHCCKRAEKRHQLSDSTSTKMSRVINRIPGADITLHAGPGTASKAELAALDGVGNPARRADVLLSRASDLGADLVVMGAYGPLALVGNS